ncbi:MAG: hypothetical protein FWC81_01785, partial [Coriobacteriia bacterium]|nr:hypothetical protein [Coriobacteriia bacterium]
MRTKSEANQPLKKRAKLAQVNCVILVAVFLLSLPIMGFIKVYAIFARGYVIWLAPWLLSFLSELLLRIEVGATIIVTTTIFAIAAALQNTLIAWIYLRYKDSSKFVRIGCQIFAGIVILIVLLIFLRHYISFG